MTSPSEKTPRGALFIMMALEFFIWGAWLPLIFGYLPSLGFTPTQQSLILGAFPVASIIGMFFSNQWADRKFAPEKFLAFSHLVGVLAAFSQTLPHTPVKKVGAGAGERLAWLEALRLLKHPFVLVLWLVTLVDSFVHNCYFNWTGVFLLAPQTAGGVGIASNLITPV